MKNTLKNRRHFLKASAATALLGSGMGAMNGKLNLMSSALAASGDYAGLTDYKSLVCVFLYGGSDSFNLFVPLSNYDGYSTSRGGLAIPQSALLASADSSIGFNPNMPELQNYYDSGKLALISNVGNIIQPTTRAQVDSGSALMPADLFAHNHQQEQVQKGLASQPQSLVGAGWGGRMADLLFTANESDALPPSFTLAGSNHWQAGVNTLPVSVNAQYGPRLMTYLDPNTGGSQNVGRDAALANILSLQHSHPLQRFASDSFTRARDNSRKLSSALASSPTLTTSYNSGSKLAQQLRMVARLIAVREQLGQRRQIFFVGMGGWDTHDTQSPRLVQLARDLSTSLASFQTTLAELAVNSPGLEEQVTTFTTSDFGRTLTINGDGSDHGWGGHYLVMGGAVNGGQLVGSWPDYAIGGPHDMGDDGRIIPTISLNQYGAALGSWMGLSEGDLHTVFPDLQNFEGAEHNGWQSQYGLFNT
ncbi:MAG: DUF1501 domain-containing protein [Gammaproteobacteria bacterium]|nr:DUF1501 domain-containing protein [Gammaproteobacteria bacterium]